MRNLWTTVFLAFATAVGAMVSMPGLLLAQRYPAPPPPPPPPLPTISTPEIDGLAGIAAVAIVASVVAILHHRATR
jgi:hypothetical protein